MKFAAVVLKQAANNAREAILDQPHGARLARRIVAKYGILDQAAVRHLLDVQRASAYLRSVALEYAVLDDDISERGEVRRLIRSSPSRN